MDNFEHNRLNFSNIVNKHLREHHETKYFHPTQVNCKHNKWSTSANGMVPDKLNIQGKLDSIVAYVHTQLKDRKPSPKSKPIPRYKETKYTTHEAATRDQGTDQKLALYSPGKATEKLNMRADKNNIIIDNPSGNNKCIIIDNPAHRKITIPRIKVLCSHKQNKRLHHTVPSPNDNNHYVNQQRLDEAKRQHEVYDSMLQDQKQLQYDRRSIAQEILTMRSYLDEIRGRLDSSLKKLDANKTYSECHPRKEQKEEKNQSFKAKRQNALKSDKKKKCQ